MSYSHSFKPEDTPQCCSNTCYQCGEPASPKFLFSRAFFFYAGNQAKMNSPVYLPLSGWLGVCDSCFAAGAGRCASPACTQPAREFTSTDCVLLDLTVNCEVVAGPNNLSGMYHADCLRCCALCQKAFRVGVDAELVEGSPGEWLCESPACRKTCVVCRLPVIGSSFHWVPKSTKECYVHVDCTAKTDCSVCGGEVPAHGLFSRRGRFAHPKCH